nr:glycosyltransferase family 4 protein [Parvibaculum sp.]
MPAYLPESFGGAQQQSRRFATLLAGQGIQATILAPRTFADTPGHEVKDGVRIKRFTLRSFPNLGGRHFFSFLWWTLRIIWWLWLNRTDYDIVHVIHARLHAVGPVLGSRLVGKPCIIKFGRGGSEFDIDVVERKRLLGPQFASIIKRYTTGFVANSAEMTTDTARHGIATERVYRIPNGAILPPEKRSDRPAPSNPVFLFMGRLDKGKAIDVMLRSIAASHADIPLRLMIVGDGPEREALVALTDELRLNERVEFTGRMEDVTPAILKADFYLSTSLSEGMSNSMLESMSFGAIPIVTRVSGVEDMVSDDKNGFLFEAGDTASCAEAIRRAAALSPERYLEMSDEARNTISRNFGLDMVVERHLELYRGLIDKNATAAQ